MGWQAVGNRRYYYRYKKVRGRVISQYAGCGLAGELAAAQDIQRRAERPAQRQARQAEQEWLAAAEEPSQRLCESGDLLARAALTAAGYHRHDRSPWRLRKT